MNKKPKVCIYTAIYGDYDVLKEQPQQTLDCDFLCFTDSSAISGVNQWEIVNEAGDSSVHPRMQAKYYKLMNHKIFSSGKRWWSNFLKAPNLRQYDVTIWIDGSIKLKTDTFAEEMISFLGDYGMAMFVHPERNCIYDEAEFCCDYPKYRNLPMVEQVAHYRSKGYPVKNGLMAAGVITRNMHMRGLNKINQDWWQENLSWTYQDQLSLPYVLWGNKLGYDQINLDLWNNHLFELIGHKSEL